MVPSDRQHDRGRPDRARRSCLVVPATSPRMVQRSRTLAADLVILDLEDAVAPDVKDEGRSAVVAALLEGGWAAPSVSVRVNAPGTPWLDDDLDTVVTGAGGHLATIVLPKVRSSEEVRTVSERLDSLERRHGLQPGGIGLELQAEDATGLLEARSILAASARTEAFILGPGDMAAALGMPTMSIGESAEPGGGEWHGIRLLLLLEARHAGVQAIDGPYGRIDDEDGLVASARAARTLGYDGKWVIHPAQIGPVNELFGVGVLDLERAVDLLDAYAAASDGAATGAVRFRGEMIDEASRRMARTIVARATAQGLAARPVPSDVPVEERPAWRAQAS